MSHCIMGLYRPVLRCVTSLLGPLVIVYIMWAPGTSKISVKFFCWRWCPLLAAQTLAGSPKNFHYGISSSWRRNDGTWSGRGRFPLPRSAAPVPACSRRDSALVIEVWFPPVIFQTSRCPAGINRRLRLLTEAPCRSSKETEAAHAGDQCYKGRTLRFRTSETRDTPGRTLCPLADGDTSDLCQGARILHSWIISRDGTRPRAGSVMKELYFR